MRGAHQRFARSALALFAATATGGALALTSTINAGATVVDTIVVGPNTGTPITNVVEGDLIGGDGNVLVGQFADSGNTNPEADCNASRYAVTIRWGDNLTSVGAVSCTTAVFGDSSPIRIFDVKGNHVYEDSASYTISLLVKDTADQPNVSATGNSDTATIKDAGLGVDQTNAPNEGNHFTTTEGKALEVKVAFFDDNNAFPSEDLGPIDAGITATVDWGDGQTQSVKPAETPSAFCDACAGDAFVDATHVYDGKATNYTIKVTATDDGGSTASQTFTAAVSDAALTSGTPASLSAVAGTAATKVVGSFTDAAGAQAAASDFTATIKWGDNATSSGTITKTAAGAFSVSGTHTYAAAGSRSLTITVTDEEGQTVTLTATAAVNAAPIVLPQTGSPAPAGPPWILLYLAIVVLGAHSLATGLARRRQPKR